MRVLIDGRAAQGARTGIGAYALQLAEALVGRSEVEAVGLWVGGQVLGPAELRAAVSPRRAEAALGALRRVGGRTLPFARQALLAMRARRLRHACADWSLFHEPNYVSSRVPVPLVTTVCDLSFLTHPAFMPTERRRWLSRHLEACLRRSAAVLAISEFTRDELLEHFPKLEPGRISVTPLGVDHARFRPEPDACDTKLHERLGLPPRFVLQLGTLEPRKNLQGLLHAHQSLPAELQREFPIVLAGAPGWRQRHFHRLLSRLREQGTVRVLGYVADADVPALLRAATVFAFPSFHEGFGLPPLEAAACGTPVLCSRAASLPEVMGDAALYVDPEQPEEIARGLRQLLGDEGLRARLGRSGIERARGFSWDECAMRTLRAYEAVG